ncbi:amino acid permease [Serratia ureilytica]|uniref:amino acid permease n=1 Tax=Serratia ureilytica TaxID=300181 RepID=UPI003FA709C2
MLGAGVFSLPQNMAQVASPAALLLGWGITGVGILFLAFAMLLLTRLRPDLDGGIFTYAKEGFGELMGFCSAWGYWLCAVIANVSYLVIVFAALSIFTDRGGNVILGDGNTWQALIAESALLWIVHALVLRGVQTAASINLAATLAKLLPLGMFAVLAAIAFKMDVFTLDFQGIALGKPVWEQVKDTMLITLWVFIGVEGAVVVSARARNKKDVGRATMLAVLSALAVYLMVTLLSLGVVPRSELADMRNPSMAVLMVVSDAAPDFVKTVTAAMLAGLGDALPVSAFPPDGTWPVGTTQWEKRNIAEAIPVWQPDLCTQCNHCVAACPHSAIRAKVVQPAEMEHAPASLQSLDVKARDMRGQKYVLQVAPEDCTGCNLCVEVCPAKDRQNPEIKAINMASRLDNLTAEKDNYDFFLQLPEIDTAQLERIDIRTSQLITPLFEYSGACSGCGETPYIKLLTQLYGDRLLIANATGCSSIYGGNLPTTPYTTNAEGRGPAWANSLFEDNAEFGLGFRLTVDQHRARVLRLLNSLAPQLPAQLVNALQMEDVAPEPRRKQIAELRALLASIEGEDARQLAADADYLVDKSIWLIGGDGWAYDIGFGGLDHVLSLTENVNVLVLDTQCYSNTGGQQSKATPLGAVTKFGEHGKRKARKDLGVSMMMYGHVYVAQISLGAQLNQTVKAIQEAEAYPGPSLIIAYSPCEEHGYDLALSHDQMKQLTATGFWPLYRFDPRRSAEGKAALALDSRPPNSNLSETLLKEQRFRRLNAQQPEVASALYQAAEKELKEKYDFLSLLAGKAEKSAAE